MRRPPRFNRQRRWVLGSALIAAAGGLTALGLRERAQPQPTEAHKTLSSVVDTIVPADEFPGGLDAGLDQRMRHRMTQRPATRALCQRLIRAINQLTLAQHRQAFHQLTIDQREALLNRLLSDRTQKQARADLMRFRSSILTWYYHSKKGHQSLGYLLPAHYAAYRS